MAHFPKLFCGFKGSSNVEKKRKQFLLLLENLSTGRSRIAEGGTDYDYSNSYSIVGKMKLLILNQVHGVHGAHGGKDIKFALLTVTETRFYTCK